MAHRELNIEQINEEVSKIQREIFKIKRAQDQEMLRQEAHANNPDYETELLSNTTYPPFIEEERGRTLSKMIKTSWISQTLTGFSIIQNYHNL